MNHIPVSHFHLYKTICHFSDCHWNVFEEEKPSKLAVRPSAHEQEDGTVLAMCITGTSSKDSLASWIKFLEGQNPALASLPVVFLLRTPESGMQQYTEEEEEDKEGEGRELEEGQRVIGDT